METETYEVEAVEDGILKYRAVAEASCAEEAIRSGKMHAGAAVSDSAEWAAFRVITKFDKTPA